MGEKEITYEDLLDEDDGDVGLPSGHASPSSLKALLADGFPRNAGIAELSALAQLADEDPRYAPVREKLHQLLQIQQRSGN
jgi:hypothetical protein